MAVTPGLLYVTMQPKSSLADAQFHDWYNNEHGPTRLRLPFCTNGFRYRATDLNGQAGSESQPEWLAIYDITDMKTLTEETYLRLRDPPVKSQREVNTMKQIKVDRKLYDLIHEQKSAEFRKLEEVGNEGEERVLVSVALDLKAGEEYAEEWEKWYKEEHIDMLSKVPGWLRTRMYITSSIDGNARPEYVALHDYKPQNGLGGAEFQAAVSTPWAKRMLNEVAIGKNRRVYDLYYTFGPAPRHIAKDLAEWKSSDAKASLTRTFASSACGNGAVESFITTKDGVELPYRLEGSSDPSAPLIVLSNSILVDWGIWDGFVQSFFTSEVNKKYRILRYLTRGRQVSVGNTKTTVDVLASDIITILDALRIKQAAAVIGVSLGGATALNTALKYPLRVSSFISCDTSSKSPAGNSKAWGDRITIAEKEASISSNTQRPIVGEELAEATVRRWFVKESYEDRSIAEKIATVKEMVSSNDLEGFKGSVTALFEYDLKEEMKKSKVRGAFVVGAGDGVLPGTMKSMAEEYGDGAEYKVIDKAGHLPMVEKPDEFAEFVSEFLSR